LNPGDLQDKITYNCPKCRFETERIVTRRSDGALASKRGAN
jgi:hypothetical protein